MCNHAGAPAARTKRFALMKSPVREGNTVQQILIILKTTKHFNDSLRPLHFLYHILER